MQEIRTRLSQGFENWADTVSRHSWLILALALLVTIALASQLPNLRVDTDVESFLHPDDPDVVLYDEFREQFGRDDRIVIGIETDDVFSDRFLTRLAELQQAIEDGVPYLEEVESLLNVRNVYGTEDELIVEDLFEVWPETVDDLNRIRSTALANPLLRNVVISEDGTFTTLVIKVRRFSETLSDDEALEQFDFDASFDDTMDSDALSAAPTILTDEQNDEVIVALQEVLAGWEGDDFKLHAAGQPVLTYTIKMSLMEDMQLFVLLGIAVIAVLLFILFRTVTAVIPPLIVVVCSLLATLSCMSIAGVPIQLPTQILPSFLLAVGIADSVHILTIFHHQLQQGQDKVSALRRAMGHAGLPILFTTMTTAGGLASFTGSGLAPVAQLGIFAPIGIFFALFYSITILPALVMIMPAPAPRESAQFRQSGWILAKLGLYALRHPMPILSVVAALVVTAAFMASQIHFSHNPLNWLADDSPLREATLTIDDRMAGTMSMEILVNTGTEDAIKNPDVLRKMEQIASDVESLSEFQVKARQSISIIDLLKEIHQALNENRDSHYSLATSRELISQELLLFENSGSEDLQDLVDTTYSKARLTLLVNWFDALEYTRFVDGVEEIVYRYFTPEEVIITGLLPILTGTIIILIESLTTSYTLALFIIVPLMMLMVSSVRVGSLAMAPNIIPILLCLGVMGAAEIPFDGFTMMIGGVAIGLVVDDTIHFLHHFKRYLDETGSVEQAVMNTLQTTGRAMLFTTIVLVCGFGAFTISSMHNLTNFGLLTGLAVALALLADILMMPALVRVMYGRSAGLDNDAPNERQVAQ